MFPAFRSIFLLLVCAYCSAQRLILQTAVDDHTTVTLREGDDPCKVIDDLCCTDDSPDLTFNECFNTVYPLVTRQLTSLWRHFTAKLAVGPSMFLGCRDADIYHGRYPNTTSLSRRDSSEQAMEDLLDILRSDGGEEAARKFDVRKNDYITTDEEQVELYLRAILLEPNHPLIVGQFGVALLAIGREDLARALFADAVRRGIWKHVMHRPVHYYVPGLTTKAWYDARDFAFAAVLEQGYGDIRSELLDVANGPEDLFYVELENRNSFSSDGSWKTLIIKESHSYTELGKTYFPKTIEWLDKCENDFLLVKFSTLDPGTHIRPHSGPSNERLRSHFTLVHSGGARLRVGEEWRTWKEGEVIVFDSSWEHEVVHEGSERRVVLILDIWHPDYLNQDPESH